MRASGGTGHVGEIVYEEVGNAYYRDSEYSLEKGRFAMNGCRRDRVSGNGEDWKYTTSANAMSLDSQRGVEGTHYHNRTDRRGRSGRHFEGDSMDRYEDKEGGVEETRRYYSKGPSSGKKKKFTFF